VLASGLADEKLNTEASRQTLQSEIRGHIQGLLDRKAQLETDKSQAIAAARRQFEADNPLAELPGPEDAWSYSLGRWMEEQEWTFEEQQDFLAEYQELYGLGARDRESAQTFIQDMVFSSNLEFLESQGFNYEGTLETLALMEEGDKYLTNLNEWIANPTAMSGLRMMFPGLRDIDFTQMRSVSEFSDMLNAFSMRSEFVANWDGYRRDIEQAQLSIHPTSGWVFPVVGGADFSNSFGYQKPASKGGHRHQGVDLYSPSGRGGEMIAAPVSGVIESLGNGSGAGGYYVKIRGDDGYLYYFAHNQNRHPVRQGQRVSAGQLIGYIGESGNARGTKPHTHFEIRDRNGNRLNPYQVLRGAL